MTAEPCPVCGAEPVTDADIGYETQCPHRCDDLVGEGYSRELSVGWWNQSVAEYQERAS